nr:NAD(P)/FAD-dependent oxidoreductase [Stenotrophomonas maltophilia]
MTSPSPPTSQDLPAFDAIVIGGSYAGMSAALQLARACRTVLVIDHGQPRNQRAGKTHGCLGWDGVSPAAMLETGRRQLLAYERVQWATDEATDAAGSLEAGFRVDCASGDYYYAQRLLLAHGVEDRLPDVPGLAERWEKPSSIAPTATAMKSAEQPSACLLRPDPKRWTKSGRFLSGDRSRRSTTARFLRRRWKSFLCS